MAVSFKVPASPKKNIFVIDEFMGTDLTNTGANIEEVRSPHAENMVRYVPGKVRKRMGYKKEILFGRLQNVNFAADTSSRAREIFINPTNVDTFIKLYDTIETLTSSSAFNLYLEFDYTSDDEFKIFNEDTIMPGSEEWTHASLVINNAANTEITSISVKSSVEQEIYIKNFSIMKSKDANYSWSPAPLYFVERNNNDPVYGCHVIKSNEKDGNRVVNVNRALETSSSFQTFSLNQYGFSDLYSLAENLYIDSDGKKAKVYLDFDYISSAEANLNLVGISCPNLQNTNGGIRHYSINGEFGSYSNYKIQAKSLSGNLSIQIKNLTLVYEKDENYTWTPAPEDSDETFNVADVYNVGSTNYAVLDANSASASGSSATVTIDITDADSNVKGFQKVSFDCHTSITTGQTVTVRVALWSNQGSVYNASKTFSGNIVGKHIEFYATPESPNYYIQSVKFYFSTTSGSSNVQVDLSHIKVNNISIKESFTVSSKYYLYHVGKDFFLKARNSDKLVKIFDDANEHLSQAWQLNDKMFILDGKNVYTYAIGDEQVESITDGKGYIPLVTIAKRPKGGGVSYEPLNMLQPAFYEQFCVTTEDENATWFYLSFGGLDDTEVKVWILDQNGKWNLKHEHTDFDVNRGFGIIFFTDAKKPGASPIAGEDNVKVLAYRTVTGYADRIKKCTIGTLFGVGGAKDRLFLSGNPDYPNWDFYSEQFDPSYFPDTGYASLGSSASAIVGYAIVNNYLATFKDGFDTSQSVFIREGDMIIDEESHVSNPAFKLINTLQGNGVIAPYAFGYLETEPVFLTKAGVFAITAQDITGEKYSQSRSFYLNGKLTQEPNMENAVAVVHNDLYIIALNNQLYILDGLQATRTDRSDPYATRQYVGFYCKDVPAVCLLHDDDYLWFGTTDGKVCKFYNDPETLNSYNDDGKEIYACWETPDLDGKLFYKNKTFRYFAVRLMKAMKTSIKLFSQKLGTWTFIKEDDVISREFDFDNLDFEIFTFSTDTSEKVIHTKVRVKKVDKARFRVENGELNEPFGLFDLALEYIESGNYKG